MSSLTLQILFLILSTLPPHICISQSPFTKSIHLTPNTPQTTSGISITTSPSVSVLSNQWIIDVKTQTGSDLHIQLPTQSQYTFHPLYPSTMSFIMHGTTPNKTHDNDGEIIFLFSVNNSYFADIISLDKRRSAYKQCPSSNTPLILRDINVMINANFPQRYYRFCKNPVSTNFHVPVSDYWTNHLPPYKKTANWPMYITITNNPIENSVYYTWSDDVNNLNKISSYYTSSFDANQAVNMYISGDNLNEYFTISDIHLTYEYTANPTQNPTVSPTMIPTVTPTLKPTSNPSIMPTLKPTLNPTVIPTLNPSINPTFVPSLTPSFFPTVNPTTLKPSKIPSSNPSKIPTPLPSFYPTVSPTFYPTIKNPTTNPTLNPTINPTLSPTLPTINPTHLPSFYPTLRPTNPTLMPSFYPSFNPSNIPIKFPTVNPTKYPSFKSTQNPTTNPTNNPSILPSYNPIIFPTNNPSIIPTISPSNNPSTSPFTTLSPTTYPTIKPTIFPTNNPSIIPTLSPSHNPTKNPSNNPSIIPTISPSYNPTINPTSKPTKKPKIKNPTSSPLTTPHPTIKPTKNPTITSIYPSVTSVIMTTSVQLQQNDDGKTVDNILASNIITMPVIIVILIVSFALCSICIVTIRQLCKPRKQKKEKIKNRVDVDGTSPSETESLYRDAVKHIHESYHVHLSQKPLSDTDSLADKHVRHAYNVQARPDTNKSSTITYNKSIFFDENQTDESPNRSSGTVQSTQTTITSEGYNTIINETQEMRMSESSVNSVSESSENIVPEDEAENMKKFIQLVADKRNNNKYLNEDEFVEMYGSEIIM